MAGFDGRKFKELILYFSKKCKSTPYFGSVKLNKLLYFSDFVAYGRLGKPVTGATYIHLPKGPGPSQMLPVRNEMEKHGDLRIEPVQTPQGSQQRTIAQREPDMSLFSAEEIAICDEVFRLIEDKSALEASDVSHKWAGWRLTAMKEAIPYYTMFVRYLEPITLADQLTAEKLLAQAGR